MIYTPTVSDMPCHRKTNPSRMGFAPPAQSPWPPPTRLILKRPHPRARKPLILNPESNPQDRRDFRTSINGGPSNNG